MIAQAFATGVYGLVGGSVNVFILDDPQDGVTVIDAGLAGTSAQIAQLVQDIGRTPHDIRQILVTHADLDHIGDLKALADLTGARVYASAFSQTYIEQRQIPPHLKFPIVLVANAVAFFGLKAARVDQIVKDGDVLPIAGGIRVLATPGHTPDHVSYFWEREKVLFTGDLLRNVEGLTLTPARVTDDIEAARRSARLSIALDPTVICAGHGHVWQRDRDMAQLEALQATL